MCGYCAGRTVRHVCGGERRDVAMAGGDGRVEEVDMVVTHPEGSQPSKATVSACSSGVSWSRHLADKHHEGPALLVKGVETCPATSKGIATAQARERAPLRAAGQTVRRT